MFEERVLTRVEDLQTIRADWEQLFEDCPWATPFQTPAWQIAWWNELGGGELRLITLWGGRRLVALLPMFLWGDPGARRLSFVGAGISDYQDALVAEDAREEGTRRLLGALASLDDEYAACEIEDVPYGSPLLSTPPPPGVRIQVEEIGASLNVPLPASFAELERGLPWRFRRSLRTARNHLERAPCVEWVLASRDEVDDLISELFRLHRLRWQSRRESGVLWDARVQAFHRTAARLLSESGRLRLWGLRLRGAFVAILYGFEHRGRTFAYLTGFDPGAEALSPGVAILRRAIEHAIAAGGSEFDMLRGNEAYKYRWNARERMRYRLHLVCDGSQSARG